MAGQQAAPGEGVFITSLREELKLHNITIPMCGIRAYEQTEAVSSLKELLKANPV
jgi:hypothetical protein